jgi:uracil-DNA glycosylase
MSDLTDLGARVNACRLCAARFAATATAHQPRPVLWLSGQARILIAGQAPGLRVHGSGRPFDDASGQRLRDWMGIGEDVFWDRARVGFLPMAFCFPGYNAAGHDLPPPAICAATWRQPLIDRLPRVRLTLLVGGHAQRWHLGAGATKAGVNATVTGWRAHAPVIFPLPHPSWRNTGWLKRNPWFGDELLPALRARVAKVLAEDD